MRIYFSGIGGVGVGALAMLAQDAGHEVCGSNQGETLTTRQLQQRGITFSTTQTGAEIARAHAAQPIDWLVYSSAVPEGNPELVFAREHGIRLSKRHELLNYILADKRLKLIAVAGTHGKTTTTGMLIWLFKELGLPVSYSVGTNISFGPAGHYQQGSEYFVYEADEYDRNFLNFQPHLSVLPSVTYDHPDIFQTPQDYKEAFRQFIAQSERTILWQRDAEWLGLSAGPSIEILPMHEAEPRLGLAGQHVRANGWLAITTMQRCFPELKLEDIVAALERFPGTERRFERLGPNLYTDYAHHPDEIAATLQLARELNDRVVVVYQPHQNRRQHEIQHDYGDCFADAEHVYWLPTYLSREDPQLAVLTPTQLIANMHDPTIAEPAELDDALQTAIHEARAADKLVLLMSAGSLDQWARDHLANL